MVAPAGAARGVQGAGGGRLWTRRPMQPEDIETLLDRANRLLEAGKPDESLRCLDELDAYTLETDDRIEWASLRAWALSEMGRDEEALDTLYPLLD